MNLRPLRPEGCSDASKTLQNAAQNDATANRYHERYTRSDDLRQLAEQLKQQLTTDELGALSAMLDAPKPETCLPHKDQTMAGFRRLNVEE